MLILALASAPVWAQGGASLKSIPVVKPDLTPYVRDEKTLVALGKALFWDMQVSSDNRVACATCHFHAGADHRQQNQLTTTKDPVALNWALAPGDFPFGVNFMAAGHRAGSAGMYPREITSSTTDGKADEGNDLDGDAYPNIHGLNLRQVTRRNAPSVINSVYNYRNFWDGRASNTFSGWTMLGEGDPRANVLVDRAGALEAIKVRIEHAGLASQAVGPPLDAGEMSYRGRTWPMLGRKMLTAHPLARQRVAPDDSVLGPYVAGAEQGLAPQLTYESLIRAAFHEELWRSQELVAADGTSMGRQLRAPGGPGFFQEEYNFPLFFGLAIQAYETTLVSDDSPYDRLLDGKKDALNALELTGLSMFNLRACASCHVDPELTLATYRGVLGDKQYKALGPNAGFFQTGVEPNRNDEGLGGRDFSGAFKTPSLRNVEFTGPYFHTGSKSTLAQIVDFYTIGGDYGSGNLRRWGPDPFERQAMPAFMRTFSDDRVRFERAPFDHPELCVAIGHIEDDKGAARPKPAASHQADERWAGIPPVGAKGNSVPLQTFEELLLGVGKDGSRAHHLGDACRIE